MIIHELKHVKATQFFYILFFMFFSNLLPGVLVNRGLPKSWCWLHHLISRSSQHGTDTKTMRFFFRPPPPHTAAKALSARLLICPYSRATFKNSSKDTLPSWEGKTRPGTGSPGVLVISNRFAAHDCKSSLKHLTKNKAGT